MELYKKHRPKTFKGIIGNISTVRALQNMLERDRVPHTILFHGPSGCGKTTLARILKIELGCHDDFDFIELNCSDFRGIDTIRDIRDKMHLAPVAGKCKVWVLDEVHQMSSAGQNAALKILEDTPKHVYFFLCTTDPHKILKTIQNRCTMMPVEYLEEAEMMKLIMRICKREKIKIKQDTAEDMIDSCSGSARKVLVLLDKIRNIPENERGKAISMEEEEKEGIDLCRALIQNKGWVTISKMIKEIKSDPEQLRWSVMGYCSAILLRKYDSHVHHILTCFKNNFYDSKKFGLVEACCNSIYDNSKKKR